MEFGLWRIAYKKVAQHKFKNFREMILAGVKVG